MKKTIPVQLRGYSFKVSPEDIEKIAKSTPSSRGRKYITIVGGKIFAPKDLITRLIEEKNIPLTRMDFTTMDAVRILAKLGFKTEEINKRRRKSLLSYAGVLSLGGDSLKESKVWYE